MAYTKKKKVLHVTPGGLGGGVGTVILSIAKGLQSDYEMDCIVYKKQGHLEKEFKSLGNLYRLNCYDIQRGIIDLLRRPWVLFWGVFRICTMHHYDVIHCHNDFDQWVCLMAARIAGVRIRIAHAHNPISKHNSSNFLHKLRVYINRAGIKIFATEKISCSTHAGQSFYNCDDFKVILNSVDLEKFNKASISERFGNKFIHIGRYNYQKNQEFVIQVFKEIKEYRPNIHLDLVGFGEDKNKLQQLIKGLNLNNSIHLVDGKEKNVSELLQSADYMIFPSRFEGFGIVLLEAQVMGVMCFASDRVPPETNLGLVEYLSLKKTPEEWAEQIMKSTDNKQRYKERCFAVHNNAKKFSPYEINKQYRIVYEARSL